MDFLHTCIVLSSLFRAALLLLPRDGKTYSSFLNCFLLRSIFLHLIGCLTNQLRITMLRLASSQISLERRDIDWHITRHNQRQDARSHKSAHSINKLKDASLFHARKPFGEYLTNQPQSNVSPPRVQTGSLRSSGALYAHRPVPRDSQAFWNGVLTAAHVFPAPSFLPQDDYQAQGPPGDIRTVPLVDGNRIEHLNSPDMSAPGVDSSSERKLDSNATKQRFDYRERSIESPGPEADHKSEETMYDGAQTDETRSLNEQSSRKALHRFSSIFHRRLRLDSGRKNSTYHTRAQGLDGQLDQERSRSSKSLAGEKDSTNSSSQAKADDILNVGITSSAQDHTTIPQSYFPGRLASRQDSSGASYEADVSGSSSNAVRRRVTHHRPRSQTCSYVTSEKSASSIVHRPWYAVNDLDDILSAQCRITTPRQDVHHCDSTHPAYRLDQQEEASDHANKPRDFFVTLSFGQLAPFVEDTAGNSSIGPLPGALDPDVSWRSSSSRSSSRSSSSHEQPRTQAMVSPLAPASPQTPVMPRSAFKVYNDGRPPDSQPQTPADLARPLPHNPFNTAPQLHRDVDPVHASSSWARAPASRIVTPTHRPHRAARVGQSVDMDGENVENIGAVTEQEREWRRRWHGGFGQ